MRFWTRGEDEDLRRLCADERLSYGVIAGMLSRQWKRRVSRSSVGQRARRLGLRIHERVSYDPLRACQIPPQRQRYVPPEDPVPAFRNGLDFPDPEPHAPGVLLINAAARDCRWPVKGAGAAMRVCGEPVAAGSPYCPACRRLAYERPPESGGRFLLKTPEEMREWRRRRQAAE